MAVAGWRIENSASNNRKFGKCVCRSAVVGVMLADDRSDRKGRCESVPNKFEEFACMQRFADAADATMTTLTTVTTDRSESLGLL